MDYNFHEGIGYVWFVHSAAKFLCILENTIMHSRQFIPQIFTERLLNSNPYSAWWENNNKQNKSLLSRNIYYRRGTYR